MTEHDAKGLGIIAGWIDKDGLIEPAAMLRRLASKVVCDTSSGLVKRVDHIDEQGYVHWKMRDDTKGPRGVDDVAGRDRSLSRTGAQDDPQLSPGQCAIEEAIGKLHIATSQLNDPRNVSGLILEAIDKLNWISANPESFYASPAEPPK